jgi:hypothetical protein
MTHPETEAHESLATESRTTPVCPSSTCHEGAVVIGVLGESGRLGYIRPPVPVDPHFAENASRHGDPESRFRFADNCVRHACEHWTGQQCGLIGRLVHSAHAQELELATKLPRCAVRADCQWFAQNGQEACAVCPLVVYRPK